MERETSGEPGAACPRRTTTSQPNNTSMNEKKNKDIFARQLSVRWFAYFYAFKIFRSLSFAADAKPTIAPISISISIFGTGSPSGAWNVGRRIASHAIRPSPVNPGICPQFGVSSHALAAKRNGWEPVSAEQTKKNEEKITQKSDHLPKSTHICDMNASNIKSTHRT